MSNEQQAAAGDGDDLAKAVKRLGQLETWAQLVMEGFDDRVKALEASGGGAKLDQRVAALEGRAAATGQGINLSVINARLSRLEGAAGSRHASAVTVPRRASTRVETPPRRGLHPSAAASKGIMRERVTSTIPENRRQR
jgi:hypothetical protein